MTERWGNGWGSKRNTRKKGVTEMGDVEKNRAGTDMDEERERETGRDKGK